MYTFIRNLLLLALLFVVSQKASFSRPQDYSLVDRATAFARLLPQEKVYLHFDNTAYFLDETIWFKAYVVCGSELRATERSRVLYVELVAPEGYVVETKKLKIEEGGCHGGFDLHPNLLSGYYEVRAYTRYMLNFGEDTYFSRVFPVYDKVSNGDYAFRHMMERKRGFLYKGEWQSSDRPKCELAFYPEGGHIVEGVDCEIAYELHGADGMPSSSAVTLYADGDSLLTTLPEHEGRGSFVLRNPRSDVKYRARVEEKGKKYKFDLPAIDTLYAALHVEQGDDSVTITVRGEKRAALQGAVVCRNRISSYNPSIGHAAAWSLHKESLDEGVNRAVIFTGDGTPLAERMFFVRHKARQPHDIIQVPVRVTCNGKAPDELEKLQPHEKLCLQVEIGDSSLQGTTLSLSVSDAAASPTTSYDGDIYTHLLLSSEVKGFVPYASQYFDKENPARDRELDLLLLTHGWTACRWEDMAGKDIFECTQPIERGILIKGSYYKLTKRADHFTQYLKGKPRFDKDMMSGRGACLEFSYEDSLVTKYDFVTDTSGRFNIYLDDFYGEKYARITPMLSVKQQLDSSYFIKIDKYFSPPFRLYDYAENHRLGRKRDSGVTNTPITHTGDLEYGLDEVTVTAKPYTDSRSCPPHSEGRYNFLDEYEYAVDIAFCDDNDHPKGLPVFYVLHSIFERYNYNWCYHIKSIVIKDEYNSDSIPCIDKEYIKGRPNPMKMLDFKEVIIRSDKSVRKLFELTEDYNVRMTEFSFIYGKYYDTFYGYFHIIPRISPLT